MNAVAIGLGLSPLPDVRVPKNAFPNALSLLEAMLPFTFVDLSIEPSVHSFPMWFIVLEFALVLVSVGVAFHAAAISVIVEPLALVQPGCPVLANAQSMALSVD